MAKQTTTKAPWIPPQEDIALFYNEMKRQMAFGQCVSVKDAQEKTFAALKQPGMPWAGNSYGPRVCKTLFEHLPYDQQQEISAHFGITMPPAPPQAIHTFGRKLELDANLRTQFITFVAEGHSRPEVAVEFDIPLATVSSVFTQAMEAELGINSGLGRSAEKFVRDKIEQLSNKNAKWGNLHEILDVKSVLQVVKSTVWGSQGFINRTHTEKGSPEVIVRNWPPQVTDEEIEVHHTLAARKHTRQNPISPDDISIPSALNPGLTPEDFALNRGGGPSFSNRIASEQIPGGRVTRR